MAEAFCVLRELKLPVSGYAMDIGLVEFSPVREHFSFGLGNAVEPCDFKGSFLSAKNTHCPSGVNCC
ncbi:hypothetical protein J1N35_033172 [Gossypium stocksii]|uniref:Uncharacterized protein n=1 Tax=Gossypium stocksii TaxID=47602 RepID=A0A9D3UPP1_9ROSI|nr:hypothetical protein J1N35_033172 [Gossypium stocksii]